MTELSRDEQDLARFGYKQELKRSLGVFSSFAVAFSYISPSTGIFALFFARADDRRRRLHLELADRRGRAVDRRARASRSCRATTRSPAPSSSGRSTSPGRRIRGSPAGSISSPASSRSRPCARHCRSRSSRPSTTWAGISRTPCVTSAGSRRSSRSAHHHDHEHLRRPLVALVNNTGVLFEILGMVVFAFIARDLPPPSERGRHLPHRGTTPDDGNVPRRDVHVAVRDLRLRHRGARSQKRRRIRESEAPKAILGSSSARS